MEKIYFYQCYYYGLLFWISFKIAPIKSKLDFANRDAVINKINVHQAKHFAEFIL